MSTRSTPGVVLGPVALCDQLRDEGRRDGMLPRRVEPVMTTSDEIPLNVEHPDWEVDVPRTIVALEVDGAAEQPLFGRCNVDAFRRVRAPRGLVAW